MEKLLIKPPRSVEDPVDYDRSEEFRMPWDVEDVPTLAGGVTLVFLWYALVHGI